jgi:acyl-CoA thioester hydrolase
MSEDFTYLLRVRYSECDAQKVVFNGRYAEYVDIAATEFIKVLWGNANQLLDRGIDFQVVNLNLSWRAPAQLDDVLAIQVRTKHVGNSSYSLAFEFHNYATNALIASAEAVYVMVDSQLNKKHIADNLRDDLNAGAPAIVVNHAGVS